MRVGLIVDGEAEYHSIGLVLSKLYSTCPLDYHKTLKADLQPKSTPAQIAHNAVAKTRMLCGHFGCDVILVLVDLEDRADCPGAFAAAIASELRAALGNDCAAIRLGAVVKVRAFENWLISDPEAFVHLPARFPNRKHIAKAAANSRADQCPAYSVLKKALAGGTSFDKKKDASRICGHASPEKMAANSRSFRRLLRELGHPDYADQSRQPST